MITFHDIYQRYAPDVYRFAFWLSGDAAEAEDITAETFARAWTRKGAIRTETVKAYLFTIARNLHLAHRRRMARQVALVDEHADPNPGPDRQTEDRLRLQAVLAAIQSLPETGRAALLLRVQHDLPYREIARILNLSVSAVKVKVHRARLKLAQNSFEEGV